MELQVKPNIPTLMILGGKTKESVMPIHIAWVRQGDEDRPKSRSLQQKFITTGLYVAEVSPDHSTLDELRTADLILVEYYGYFHTDLPALLNQVRANSHAPVVMLTDNQTFDWSSAAIASGADATVTLNTPDEVIVARCQALLRRWRSGR